ncbi:MAG TPA: hypothetical protein VNR20_01680 [Terriglobales bacterium]|nr:hypothetical protein [Terriglobales bacterium]
MRKRWLKIGVVLAGVALLLMILAPRLWVKNSRAHLAIDGHVTDDFRLYFGPKGRMLLRIGDKQPRQTFLYTGDSTAACPTSEFLFPPFIALSKRTQPRCQRTDFGAIGNKLLIMADGHEYEVTWFEPPR